MRKEVWERDEKGRGGLTRISSLTPVLLPSCRFAMPIPWILGPKYVLALLFRGKQAKLMERVTDHCTVAVALRWFGKNENALRRIPNPRRMSLSGLAPFSQPNPAPSAG